MCGTSQLPIYSYHGGPMKFVTAVAVCFLLCSPLFASDRRTAGDLNYRKNKNPFWTGSHFRPCLCSVV